MTRKDRLRWVLLAGLWILSLGGWLLHLRIHPLAEDGANWIPFLSGLLSLVIVPWLFLRPATVAYGYVLNGMLVILGTITMANDSLESFRGTLTANALLFRTLFPNILILWGKFFLGQALFELASLKSPDEPVRGGRFWRYPNYGWWAAHLAGFSAVFALGRILWP